jgi:hypothetical protein
VAEQLEDVFRPHGLPIPQPADDDRIGGWRLLYNGFRQTCALRGETVDPERASQGPLLLVSANCPEVISAIPILTRDNQHPGKLEDVLKTNTKHDDVGDCLRYGYKSMLSPRSKPPRDVEIQAIYRQYPDPTARARAMAEFQQLEQNRRRTTQRGNFR